jgi:transcriptional regulator with XRE-family HTH domain
MEPRQIIREARRRAALSQRELARRSGTSQPTLSAYEAGRKMPSAATLARLLAACGERLTSVPATRAVRFPTFEQRRRSGRRLTEVLDLAEQLPARHAQRIRYPRLPRGADR